MLRIVVNKTDLVEEPLRVHGLDGVPHLDESHASGGDELHLSHLRRTHKKTRTKKESGHLQSHQAVAECYGNAPCRRLWWPTDTLRKVSRKCPMMKCLQNTVKGGPRRRTAALSGFALQSSPRTGISWGWKRPHEEVLAQDSTDNSFYPFSLTPNPNTPCPPSNLTFMTSP